MVFKFLVFQMWSLFEGGACLRAALFKIILSEKNSSNANNKINKIQVLFILSFTAWFGRGQFPVFITELRKAKVLGTELNRLRALKYTHFELKSIVIEDKKTSQIEKYRSYFISAYRTILTLLQLGAAFL